MLGRNYTLYPSYIFSIFFQKCKQHIFKCRNTNLKKIHILNIANCIFLAKKFASKYSFLSGYRIKNKVGVMS